MTMQATATVSKMAFTASANGSGVTVTDPYVSIEQTADGAVVTVTDAQGSTTATIYNGVGITSVEKTGTEGLVDTYTITFTDATTTTFTVTNAQSYTVDSELSDTSENPVQNKVIKGAIGEKIPIVAYGAETVLVDTTTVSFSKDGDNDWYISAENPIQGFSSSNFSHDVVYTVEWDGVVYDDLYCRVSSKETDSKTWYEWSFIGNIEPLGYNGGNSSRAENIPFCIEYDYKQNKAEVQIISYDTADSHTVKISSRPVTKTLIENTLFLDSYRGVPVVRLGEKGGVLEGLANYAAEYAHAEGECTEARGEYSHAEGGVNKATGTCSHSEGRNNTASGEMSHAEGYGNTASGHDSHAEGYCNTASGQMTHAEGYSNTASGHDSHAEGYSTVASNWDAHAEGDRTVASGENSHAQNRSTIAQGVSQTAIGRYNIAQGTSNSKADTDYAFIIGNGTDDNARSNAFAIRWDGAIVLANGTVLTVSELASVATLYTTLTSGTDGQLLVSDGNGGFRWLNLADISIYPGGLVE